MERLAFEIEHAEMFAHTRRRRHPPSGTSDLLPNECSTRPLELNWVEILNEIHSLDDDDPEI